MSSVLPKDKVTEKWDLNPEAINWQKTAQPAKKKKTVSLTSHTRPGNDRVG